MERPGTPNMVFNALVALTIISTGSTQSPTSNGHELFTANCERCHGPDGSKGRFGAKNLIYSHLPDSAIVLQIQKGKGFMPSFRKKLAPEEIQQLVIYVKTLRE